MIAERQSLFPPSFCTALLQTTVLGKAICAHLTDVYCYRKSFVPSSSQTTECVCAMTNSSDAVSNAPSAGLGKQRVGPSSPSQRLSERIALTSDVDMSPVQV
jgi:hypothetical protein